MNDPEAPRRWDAVTALSGACDCIEHAPVKLGTGDAGQIDVLCRPKLSELAGLSLAIEVKSHARVGDRELGRWIKQAADYVGAIPTNGWPQIVASFIWLVGMELHPNEHERLRMAGMLQLAQHFRVGAARSSEQGLYLVFGPSAGIFYRNTWTPRAAELLGAKRIAGGVRKPLAT